VTRTKIELIDTTLRDGHQSLWALGMTNEMMLPSVEPLDRAGFDGMEFWIPQIQIFKGAVDLGENNMHWLHMGAPLAKETRLRLHGGMETGLRYVPKPIHRLLLQRMVDYGVTVSRSSDPWNNFERLAPSFVELRDIGFDPIANLTYSVSPIHTDEHYVERAHRARSMGMYRLCFKDVGGLLTPERARTLMPKIVEAAGDLEVEFHAHCNSGLAPLCVV
jgi:oxaloacetate decarboxylase (Na+ extruding) subunit alpha